ncbi:MAG: flagellar hook-associated protein FlgK, partial [Lachnospiraceae bacterium]|nr:flagellar hook-associated protein FlgK [Lachnospiraceae bacterium]
MSSTFFGLTIAGSGLRAANANLNTTANNISNQETKGYSRQTVNVEAADAIRVFTTYGCAGAGVETLSIERTRDHFYDIKYWNNEAKLGTYEKKQYYQMQIEDLLTDDSKSGFKTLFNTMTSALYEITKNPDSTPVKQTFISSAKSMADYFNNMSANLMEIQEDANDEIKNTVDRINACAEELATLSNQINAVRIAGGNVNSLLDHRENVLDELSKLVKVETEETPIVDTAFDPPRETGGTRLVVKIAGGLTLTDGNAYHSLVCTARKADEKVNQSDIDGLYDISWDNGNEFVLTNKSIGG